MAQTKAERDAVKARATKVWLARRLAAGLCGGCGAPRNGASKTRCQPCNTRGKAEQNRRNKEIRSLVLVAYGMKCVCCSETQPLLLNIDHVNNDGAKHRESVGYSTRFYRWLIRNKFPEGFQIMCWNCNLGKYLNSGTCPHKTGASDGSYFHSTSETANALGEQGPVSLGSVGSSRR